MDVGVHWLKQAWRKNIIYPLILISDVLWSFLKVTGPYWNYTGKQRKNLFSYIFMMIGMLNNWDSVVSADLTTLHDIPIGDTLGHPIL